MVYFVCISLLFLKKKALLNCFSSKAPKDTDQLDPRCSFLIEVLQGWGFTCITSLSGPRECKEKHFRHMGSFKQLYNDQWIYWSKIQLCWIAKQKSVDCGKVHSGKRENKKLRGLSS